ncbi:hypothetical protein LEP1GSC125_0273 [Leptospira mayottensis 200901122]|uniref:Uncharacterized protein n=1 Tax=Leptospira mayottensis 200901122 TaxID=1193010 RepID=A0AA87SZ04_9LEPT|nr:hypothetical protein LEP1GSC125_0273 [Leptospira mayottensis 200901122]
MGKCIRPLKGKLIKSNWTERLFYFGRRLLGQTQTHGSPCGGSRRNLLL